MRRLCLYLAVAGLAAGSGWTASAQDLPLKARGEVDVSDQVRTDEEGRQIYHAKDVIGTPVKGADGEIVGTIDDLVIDSRDDQVLYALLSLDAVAEAEGKVIVLPWVALQAPAQIVEERFYIVQVPRPVLLRAPMFAPREFRRIQFTQWSPRVDQYFAQHIDVRDRTNVRSGFRGTRRDARDLDDAPRPRRTPRTGDRNNDLDLPADTPRPRTTTEDDADQPKPTAPKPKAPGAATDTDEPKAPTAPKPTAPRLESDDAPKPAPKAPAPRLESDDAPKPAPKVPTEPKPEPQPE